MKLLSLEPESSASANSATAAYESDEIKQMDSPLLLVRETGLEPVRDYHTPLKRARLPIPPLSRDDDYYILARRFCQSFFPIFLTAPRKFSLAWFCLHDLRKSLRDFRLSHSYVGQDVHIDV